MSYPVITHWVSELVVSEGEEEEITGLTFVV